MSRIRITAPNQAINNPTSGATTSAQATPPRSHFAAPFPTTNSSQPVTIQLMPDFANVRIVQSAESRLQRAPLSDPLGYLHKVQQRETLYSISRRYGVSVINIVKQNRDEVGRVRAGDTVKLPKNPKGVSSHVVKKGEYLWTIAKHYVGDDLHQVNLFVNAIFSLNIESLFAPKLRAGVTLRIPGGRDTGSGKGGGGKSGGGKSGGGKTGGRRSVQLPGIADAQVKIPVKFAKRPIRSKGGIQWMLTSKFEFSIATAAGKRILVKPDGIEATLFKQARSKLRVGLSDKGVPSIGGVFSGSMGEASADLKGKTIVFKYAPFSVEFHHRGVPYKGSVAIVLEIEPYASLPSLVQDKARKKFYQRAFKKFVQILGKRFGAKVVARAPVLLGLIAGDGPLPIGDLISLGLTLWTVAEVALHAGSMWAEAKRQAAK